MNKLVIVFSFLLILLNVGCKKSVIKPNTQTDKQNETMLDFSEKGHTTNNQENSGSKPISITDPNHDEDEDDKTKK